MLNMAAMLTNAQKSSSEPVGRFSQNLVCSIFDSSLYDDPGMTLTYFMARSILETGIYMGKGKNNGYFGNLQPETRKLPDADN